MSNINIVTLTLNPVIDTHYQLQDFGLEADNRALSVIKSAAGKGINISRALSVFGVPSRAVALLGRDNSDFFLHMLKSDNVDCDYILTEGSVRESVSLNVEGKNETRILTDTFKPSEQDFYAAMQKIHECTDENSYIAISGSIPSSISKSVFISECQKLKGKLILDTASLNAAELAQITPWLIKPNREEANALLEIAGTFSCGISASHILINKGCAQNAIISLGSFGFVYAGQYGEAIVRVPKTETKATVGAGDSTLAGVLYGIYHNFQFTDCLKMGASFGSAVCLEYGTLPPKVENVLNILPQIKIKVDITGGSK